MRLVYDLIFRNRRKKMAIKTSLFVNWRFDLLKYVILFFLYKNTYTQTHPSNWSVVLIVFVHFTLAFLSFFLFLWNLSLYDIFRRYLSVSGDSTFLITITNELDYMIIIQFHSHSHYLIPAVKSSQFIFNEFGETQKNWLTYIWKEKNETRLRFTCELFARQSSRSL